MKDMGQIEISGVSPRRRSPALATRWEVAEVSDEPWGVEGIR